MGSWQRLGMVRQVSEVQKPGFKSWMGADECGIRCCAFCDKCVWGWVKLESDGTMTKGCKSKQQNHYPSHDGRVQESVRQTHKVQDYNLILALPLFI
eukprot:14422324-Ditylum_brightwellii.AAC.1